MWHKKPWARKLRNRLLIAAAIALAVYLMYRHESKTLAAISHYSPAEAQSFGKNLALSEGPPQGETMDYAGAKWYKMAEQRPGSLWMEPSTGQIAIKDSKGSVWLSNPSADDLAKDKTAGQWKNNERSPILINFLDKEKMSEDTSNIADAGAKIRWKAIPNGVGIQYDFVKIAVSVYLEYTLDASGFVVHFPQEGVTEGEKFQVVSLSVLPFFGASLSDKAGYLFVPDGPGGLIEFGGKRADLTAPYDYPVYGNDYSVPAVSRKYNRSDISYPVFGMKRGDEGFLTIIEDGETTANVVAMPAQMKTGFNNVYAKFVWRQYYKQQKGLNADNTQNMYEKNLNASAITMRYLFLDREASDYVGMAKRYRQYLTELHGLQAKPQAGDPPLILNFIMAASEQPTPLGSNVIVATTFEEVREMVGQLHAEGILNMRVSLRGWQNGGFAGSIPDRFPMESGLGGMSRFKELQDDLRQKGIPLTMDDDLMIGVDTLGSGFSPKSNGVRQITGKVMKNYQNGDFYNQALYYYLINPQQLADRYLPKAIGEWKKLGIGGVTHMDEYGDGLFSDYNPDHPSDRKNTAMLTNKMLDGIRSELGWAGTSRPYAFTIGHVDLFHGMPLDYNYDLVVSERVPFYPIAVHGLINYTSIVGGNLRTDPQTEFLREIEYGSLPYYNLTYGDVRELRRTTYSSLVSGQFSLLKPQIVAEYRQFAAAGKEVWGQSIDGHKKLAEGLYETRYANGTRVIVNYNDRDWSGDGYAVKAMSFAVVKGGGAQ